MRLRAASGERRVEGKDSVHSAEERTRPRSLRSYQQVSVHGSLKKAAEFHGLTVKQLQDAIKMFCNG